VRCLGEVPGYKTLRDFALIRNGPVFMNDQSEHHERLGRRKVPKEKKASRR
jgi:hypothetical protein